MTTFRMYYKSYRGGDRLMAEVEARDRDAAFPLLNEAAEWTACDPLYRWDSESVVRVDDGGQEWEVMARAAPVNRS